MTTREINKLFNFVSTNPKNFSMDYRQNTNTQPSNITFPIGPVVISDLHFQGHRGGGLWTFLQLNITGTVTISDCTNIVIASNGTVDSWVQGSGNVLYEGNTTGDGTTHYKISRGEATIDAASINHTAPSTFSIIAGGDGVANVVVVPGSLSGQASTADLRAEVNGLIYYAGEIVADGVTFDASSPGRIMDQTGFLVGGPLGNSLANADAKFMNHVVTAGDETAQIVILIGAVDKGLTVNLEVVLYKKNGGVSGIGDQGLTSIIAGPSDIVITFDLLNILEGDTVYALEGLTV